MPDTTERAELIGFVLTHSMLRNEIPRLAAALSGGPMTVEVVEQEPWRSLRSEPPAA